MPCLPNSSYPHGTVPAEAVLYITNIYNSLADDLDSCDKNCCSCNSRINYGIINTTMTLAQCHALNNLTPWGVSSCFLESDGICLQCGFPGPEGCIDLSNPDAFQVGGYTIDDWLELPCSSTEWDCFLDEGCECCLFEQYWPPKE